MISANQHTVSEVLGDKFVHEIPPYQRPYAWTFDEAIQLLDDLEEAVASSDVEPYFLGSIVLIRAPGELIGQVVDGQQRLTTLTILAAVMRDLADDEREQVALAQTVYIEPNPFRAQVEAVRVRAHIEDRVFFRQAIQMPGATAQTEPPVSPDTDAQVLMWDNAKSLRDRVSHFSRQQRQSLVAYLLNRCVLVVVSTDSRAGALRIFKVLNDRGMDLANADIIKADLLEKFSDSSELAHQAARWRSLETDLGRNDFESLLEHLRFIRDKTRIRETLSEAYARRFKTSSATDVRSFFDLELAPAKIWYSRIFDGDGIDFPQEVRADAVEALAGLRLVPNKDWVSAALAVATKFGPVEKTVRAFERLEGLAWTMQLTKRYDTQRLNHYAEIIKSLDVSEAALDTSFKECMASQRSLAWSNLNGPLYTE